MLSALRYRPILCALVLGGCGMGTMLPGQIYAPSGRVLQFEIEKARRSGAVTAYDSVSGERFAGKYVGLLETVRSTSTAVAQVGTTNGVGFESSETGSNIANANAYLTGDKGTSLTCQMKIEAGFNPHGLGVCSDQKGGQYRLQF